MLAVTFLAAGCASSRVHFLAVNAAKWSDLQHHHQYLDFARFWILHLSLLSEVARWRRLELQTWTVLQAPAWNGSLHFISSVISRMLWYLRALPPTMLWRVRFPGNCLASCSQRWNSAWFDTTCKQGVLGVLAVGVLGVGIVNLATWHSTRWW